MDRRPKSGELYRHFKNKLYQIVGVAIHSETGEELVIYQALYGDFKIYARPLEMFVSEVDREKYPEVTQRYRFEKVERAAEPQLCGIKQEELQNQPEPCAPKQEELQNQPEPCGIKQEEAQSRTRRAWANQSAEEKLADFFDTEDLETRYNILVSLKGELTDLMINNLAVVLDVVIPDGDVDTRYEELKRCIRTKQKYENCRLR